MFYMLDDSTRPKRWLDVKDFNDRYGWRSPYGDKFEWDNGSRFTEAPPNPLELKFIPYDRDASDHAQFIPSFIKDTITLMRDDLIAAMEEFGVDNLDKYPARLTDPDDGTVYSNYKAVNIIGLVSAADMDKSKATVHDNIPLVDVSFDELVIDESRAQDFLLFRLTENMMTILIHESLRDHLIEKGFADMMFYDLSEVATP